MPRYQAPSPPRISLRESRVSGSEIGWRALHFATASEGFVAERVNWHSHDGLEVLMFLRGAAEYEFRSGRKLAVTGDQFLIVPAGMRHRAAMDVRGPTVHSSITIDLSAARGAGSPFTKAEMEWLRDRFGNKKPMVRAMTPLLRRLAQSCHQLIHQYPAILPTPDKAAVLRLHLARILIEAARADGGPSFDKEASIISAAITYLEQHFDRPMQMDAVAERFQCSRSRFYAVFKRETGLSPNDWLLRLRVKKAAELLATTDRTIADISFSVGFSSHAYFCQVFRKYSGGTPGDHRR